LSAGRRAASRWALLGLVAAALPSGAELLPEGDCAGVYWDLTAVFEEGDRLYARVLLSRAGPGDRIAASQGHWLDPAGVPTPFQNGRREGRFTVEADGRRLRIGSTALDLAAAVHRFEVDNDKRGVKLRVEVAAADAVPTPVHEGALAVDVVHLGSAANARVWRSGLDAPRALRGRATLVRTTHGACERDLADARVDVHRLAPGGASLLILELLAAGQERSWLGWRDGEGALHAVRPAAFSLEAWHPVATGDRLPQRLRPKDHDPAGLTGEVAVAEAHLARDPLDALPRVVRMLYWFGASPRRIWADAHSGLVLASAGDANASPLLGPALASFTFLRPPAERSPPRPPETGG